MDRPSRAIGWVLGAALFVPGGCARLGSGGGAPRAPTTLLVVNGAQTAARVGIAQGTLSSPGDADVISDLTPLLQPGETAELPLEVVATPLRFSAIALSSDGRNTLGPFACEVDLSCLSDRPVPVIWTGAEVICASLNRAIVWLSNESNSTAYLLIGDEQPALPLLPLSAGESRFAQLDSNVAGGIQVRAVRFDPVLGPTLVAFTQCPLVGTCLTVRAAFDGNALDCGGF